MRPGDLSSGPARLHLALKNLTLKWEETRELWNDSASRAFEENHLAPIAPQVGSTLETIARLAEMLDRAGRECS